MFLNNLDTVNSLIATKKPILVRDMPIFIQRLVAQSRRIILSNVFTCIPNSVISDALHQLGIKTESAVHPLHIGLTAEANSLSESELNKYKHITSFRRAVYISTEEDNPLPSSIVVNFEKETYRIFINDPELLCNVCGTPSHNAASCPQQTISISQPSESEENDSAVINSEKTVSSPPLPNISTNNLVNERSEENLLNLPPRQTNTQKSTEDDEQPFETRLQQARLIRDNITQPAETKVNSTNTPTTSHTSDEMITQQTTIKRPRDLLSNDDSESVISQEATEATAKNTSKKRRKKKKKSATVNEETDDEHEELATSSASGDQDSEQDIDPNPSQTYLREESSHTNLADKSSALSQDHNNQNIQDILAPAKTLFQDPATTPFSFQDLTEFLQQCAQPKKATNILLEYTSDIIRRHLSSRQRSQFKK